MHLKKLSDSIEPCLNRKALPRSPKDGFKTNSPKFQKDSKPRKLKLTPSIKATQSNNPNGIYIWLPAANGSEHRPKSKYPTPPQIKYSGMSNQKIKLPSSAEPNGFERNWSSHPKCQSWTNSARHASQSTNLQPTPENFALELRQHKMSQKKIVGNPSTIAFPPCRQLWARPRITWTKAHRQTAN